MTAAAARERDSYRPRSASRVSSRRLRTRGRVPAGGGATGMTTLLVGLGGTLCVLSRYGISRLTLHTDALVWSTVGINVASRPSRLVPARVSDRRRGGRSGRLRAGSKAGLT